jgi:hypothetical protein
LERVDLYKTDDLRQELVEQAVLWSPRRYRLVDMAGTEVALSLDRNIEEHE